MLATGVKRCVCERLPECVFQERVPGFLDASGNKLVQQQLVKCTLAQVRWHLHASAELPADAKPGILKE